MATKTTTQKINDEIETAERRILDLRAQIVNELKTIAAACASEVAKLEASPELLPRTFISGDLQALNSVDVANEAAHAMREQGEWLNTLRFLLQK